MELLLVCVMISLIVRKNTSDSVAALELTWKKQLDCVAIFRETRRDAH
jgi:hypothetical protein